MSKKSESVYACQNCNSVGMEYADFVNHLKIVHGLTNLHIKVKREMTSHLDGRDWYQSNYRMTIPGDPEIIVLLSVTNQREKNDPMRY